MSHDSPISRPFWVESIIAWPNGNQTRRIVDWDDRDEVREFAAIANRALRSGATVSTKSVPQECPYTKGKQ